jgi:arginyl-tRNA synthetase
MIKSDGVATYTAKDIAFALWKLGYIKENFGYAHFIEDPRGVMMYTTTMEKNAGQHHDIGNYDKAITIIDNRQIPPQEIVKSALLLLDPSQHKEYLPLGYGVVYLTPQTLLKLKYTLSDEEKKEKRLPFASRKGRSVSIDEMLDMLYKKAHTETKARNLEKDDTWLEQTAEAMSVSALRFFLIRGDISKESIFDLDEAMDMQGETGTYVLYT